ncbi:MAG: hypothetical protein HY276_07815 [Ignavibacteriales bacterium]|nr:hypothetical protein [Ignavibacteriales bacterium]
MNEQRPKVYGENHKLLFSQAIANFSYFMKYFTVISMMVLLYSCDPGLAPPPEVEPGFGGTITFAKGTWPPQDSLVNLWIFASQVYPLDSSKIFTGLLSNPPSIYIYPALDGNLPFFADSVSYSFKLPPATYRYIGVLQRFRDEINVRSIRVVGVYNTGDNPPLPIPVSVGDFQFVQGININANFHKLPPQPF